MPSLLQKRVDMKSGKLVFVEIVKKNPCTFSVWRFFRLESHQARRMNQSRFPRSALRRFSSAFLYNYIALFFSRLFSETGGFFHTD